MAPNLPGQDSNGNIIHVDPSTLPPLPGMGADGKPLPQTPGLLPPPIGGYVAIIAHSFILANRGDLWDVDVYFKAALDFVHKVIEQNGAPACWPILEKICNIVPAKLPGAE